MLKSFQPDSQSAHTESGAVLGTVVGGMIGMVVGLQLGIWIEGNALVIIGAMAGIFAGAFIGRRIVYALTGSLARRKLHALAVSNGCIGGVLGFFAGDFLSVKFGLDRLNVPLIAAALGIVAGWLLYERALRRSM